ncbi:MAG: type IV pilus assembly protein PilM [Planctomycetes bacterium]|jgi:type IV pilus assembly protein PilM|nr:type IV pilus assembly protein PilM [Planctomycetota bacterium]
MALFSPEQSFLGVDIGTTSIKIVELKKDNRQVKLMTYGFSEYLNIGQPNWLDQPEYVAKIINKIAVEASISSRSAVSALPTFSVFTSVINLSNISKKDISSAVHWEAKKVIPLPLEEMILDWKQIDDEAGKEKNNLRVLLTGAPRTLVKKYIDIFKAAQISLLSLETETFSLIRSLLGNDKSTVMLVEMGAHTTDVSIIDKSIPMLNRSIDVGGSTITKAISENLKIGLERAEQFKYDLGISLLESQNDAVPKIITDTISPIVNEIKYSINLYLSKNQRPTEKIILSGGSALLPSVANYLAKVLDMKVIIGDPWARVSYPVDLKPLLMEIGPRLSVAIGLAMREIE